MTPVLDEISSLRTQELAAITNACARIDRVLSQRPTRVGRPFRDQLTRRVFSAGPLEVGYDVIADDRRVFILTVRYDDRRN